MIGLLFGFHGRIARPEYILTSCALLIIVALLYAMIIAGLTPIPAVHGDHAASEAMLRPSLLAVVAIAPVVIWFAVMLQARRLRDMGWNPALVMPAWVVLLAGDKVAADAVPVLAIGYVPGFSTLLGVLLHLAIGLCLLSWPSAAAPADTLPEPQIAEDDRAGVEIAMRLAQQARLEHASARAPAATRAGFGRRGL